MYRTRRSLATTITRRPLTLVPPFFSFVSWIAPCLTWHARPFVCAIYATAPHDIEQVTKKLRACGDPVAIKAAVEVVISDLALS